MAEWYIASCQVSVARNSFRRTFAFSCVRIDLLLAPGISPLPGPAAVSWPPRAGGGASPAPPAVPSDPALRTAGSANGAHHGRRVAAPPVDGGLPLLGAAAATGIAPLERPWRRQVWGQKSGDAMGDRRRDSAKEGRHRLDHPSVLQRQRWEGS